MNQYSKSVKPLVESDLNLFERDFIQYLHELSRKRRALEQCRQQLNESLLKQQESDRLLSVERHKRESDESQNKLVNNFVKVLEGERKELGNININLQVDINVLTSERDSLREQLRETQLENTELKRMLEDYEMKHQYHSAFQADINEQQNRLRSSVLYLSNMMQALKKDHEDFQNCGDWCDKTAELILLIETLKNDKESVINEREKIEQKCIFQAAELSMMKNLLEHSPLISNEHENSITKYWMNYCKELEIKLAEEKKNVLSLSEVLNISNENRVILEKQLKSTSEEKNELLERIKKYETKVEVIDNNSQTDEKIDEHFEKQESIEID